MLVRTLTLLLVAWTVHAQPIFVGPEFQVNTYTTSTQFMPAVAVEPTGSFVVVWSSDGSAGSDVNGFSIQGQRYAATGTALGSQFQVNTYTTGNQFTPKVACDASGSCVVVWESNGSAASDTSGTSIHGQLYAAGGAPLGGEFQVNTYTTSAQGDPSVAMGSAGDFVVSWQSNGSAGTDTHYGSIQAQRYDAVGAPLGGEFQVNTYTTFGQAAPAVAADGAGNFVVVWESAVLGIGSKGVRGQRYDAGGIPLGGEFQVNTYTEAQYRSAVSADTAGNFVVVWDGPDGTLNYNSVQGQRYDPTGTSVGGAFLADDVVGGGLVPAVAVGASDFLIVWISYVSPGSDTDGIGIQARRFDGATNPQGGQFQVNTYTTNYQVEAAVGTDGAGNFVVAWHSLAGNGMSDQNSSIQAQRVAFMPTTTSSSSTSTSSTSSSSTSSSSTSSSSSSSSTTSTSSSTTSSSTSSTVPPPVLLPGRNGVVRDLALAQFVARPASGQTFPLPAIDVVAQGGTLRFFDTAATAGDDTYALPAGSRWRGLGNPPGSSGYRYRGSGDAADPCKIVLVRGNIVKATCRGAGVTLRPPFDGDIGVVLILGPSPSARYCARFGGDDVRNDATLTRRRNAAPPGACP